MTHTEELQLVAELHKRAVELAFREGAIDSYDHGYTASLKFDNLEIVTSEYQVLVLGYRDGNQFEVYAWRGGQSDTSGRTQGRVEYDLELVQATLIKLRKMMVLEDLADV
jgi:hypothetical protein